MIIILNNNNNNYWYNLFDVTSSLVNENNGYSLIWDHIRRVCNNRLGDAKKFGETLSRVVATQPWFLCFSLVSNMFAIRCNLLKKVREKSRECHNRKPQPLPDTKRKRKQTKNQTSANRTNVRKALRLALSSPSVVIAMLKGLKKKKKKNKNEITQGKT